MAAKAAALAEEKVVVEVERVGVAEASLAFLPPIFPAQRASHLGEGGETRFLQTNSDSMLSVL